VLCYRYICRSVDWRVYVVSNGDVFMIADERREVNPLKTEFLLNNI
jgi:predicted type IV restriction endonuclease